MPKVEIGKWISVAEDHLFAERFSSTEAIGSSGKKVKEETFGVLNKVITHRHGPRIWNIERNEHPKNLPDSD